MLPRMNFRVVQMAYDQRTESKSAPFFNPRLFHISTSPRIGGSFCHFIKLSQFCLLLKIMLQVTDLSAIAPAATDEVWGSSSICN